MKPSFRQGEWAFVGRTSVGTPGEPPVAAVDVSVGELPSGDGAVFIRVKTPEGRLRFFLPANKARRLAAHITRALSLLDEPARGEDSAWGMTASDADEWSEDLVTDADAHPNALPLTLHVSAEPMPSAAEVWRRVEAGELVLLPNPEFREREEPASALGRI